MAVLSDVRASRRNFKKKFEKASWGFKLSVLLVVQNCIIFTSLFSFNANFR